MNESARMHEKLKTWGRSRFIAYYLLWAVLLDPLHCLDIARLAAFTYDRNSERQVADTRSKVRVTKNEHSVKSTSHRK